MSAESIGLKCGEMIVYPAHGVGIIEGVEQIERNGSNMSFYTIRIAESGMTIRVPAPSAPRIGIRPVINRNQVTKLMRLLRTKAKDSNTQNWHKRQKSYLDKIKSGSVFELAEILKELTTIQLKKELSFGEQRMYENVRQLIALEVAESKGIGREQADKLLDKAITANA